jgi:hypothetical protein
MACVATKNEFGRNSTRCNLQLISSNFTNVLRIKGKYSVCPMKDDTLRFKICPIKNVIIVFQCNPLYLYIYVTTHYNPFS